MSTPTPDIAFHGGPEKIAAMAHEARTPMELAYSAIDLQRRTTPTTCSLSTSSRRGP